MPHATVDWVATLIVEIASLVLNAILIYVFYKNRSLLKKPPNGLICNMAAADMVAPLFDGSATILGRIIGIPILYPGYLATFNIINWLFCFFVLALERHTALTTPSKLVTVSKFLSTKSIVIFCWVGPLILTLIPIPIEFRGKEDKRMAANVLGIMLWIILSFLSVAVIVMYIRMIFALICLLVRPKHQPDKFGSSIQLIAEIRVAVLLTVLLLLFLLSYIPLLYMAFGTVERRLQVNKNRNLTTLSVLGYLLHSILDPIFTLVFQRDVGESFFQTFGLPRLLRNKKPRVQDVAKKNKGTAGIQIPESSIDVSGFTTEVQDGHWLNSMASEIKPSFTRSEIF